jgi:hypothetical protein
MRSVSVVLLAGVAACQAVLGDFEVADVEGGLGVACEPGSFRCKEERLERCADDRKSYQTFARCATAGECDPTAGACRPCVSGNFACNDGVLQRCGADGAWAAQSTCELPGLCRVTMNRAAGACLAPVCEVGAFRCISGQLQVCAPTRDRFDLVEDCGSDARCSVDAAVAAVQAGDPPHCAEAVPCGDDCPPVTCRTPGATRCSTEVAAVEVCTTGGQWLVREACANETLCDAARARCLPKACALGETRCVGRTRQTCSQDQTHFEDVERCDASATCTPDGCVPGTCTDGTVRCNGVALERCTAGEFLPENRCASGALCTTDEGCKDPVCGEDLARYHCTGSILQDCRVGRDGWRDVRTCLEPTPVCDENAGRCVQMP